MLASAPDLKCEVCHAERIADFFGPGHRSIPSSEQVPSFVGPTHAAGATALFASCAYCHNDLGQHVVATTGELRCEVCHADQQPGFYGPGHRRLPSPQEVPSFVGAAHDAGAISLFGSCAFCHNEFGHNLLAATMELPCETCHADQQPGTYGPGHRALPTAEQVPSFPGPAHDAGPTALFGSCAICHNEFGHNLLAATMELPCETCHADRQPGTYGPGHRALPTAEQVPSFAGPAHDAGAQTLFGSCALCHHDLATTLTPVSEALRCPTCHTDLQPGMFGPGHESIPGPERVPSFPGPAHDTGAQAVFGSCALCHNDLAAVLTPHSAALNCVTCHDDLEPGMFGPGHESIPGPERVPSFPGPAHTLGPEARFAECGFCHNALTVTANAANMHGTLGLECATCHELLRPNEYGPGHQRVPRCVDCHTGPQTHQDPAAGGERECAVCHEPHGSANLFLVREQILTPSGAMRTVQFTNEGGLADGGFASESNRGSGICETCHRTTRVFRGDGTGAPHFSVTCIDCHTHPAGFAPPPTPTVTPTRTLTARPTLRFTNTATPTPTPTPTLLSESPAPTPTT
jgi:predicted CXXCH cytochrome family protein